MHSIAFHLGPLTVHWYGIFVALGFLAGVGTLLWKRGHASLSSEQVFDLALIAMIGGLVGARAFYVVQFWDEFSSSPGLILRIDKGGLVFYGGFICALGALCLYVWRKRLSIPRTLDVFAPAMAISHAFGRIGCFMEGCCFGKLSAGACSVVFPCGSPAARKYPDLAHPLESAGGLPGFHSLPVHPTQLYECAGNLLIFAALVLLMGRFKKGGQLAAAYIVAYGLMRFTVECFRGDHKDFLFGLLTPSQAIGLFVMAPLGIALFIFFGRRKDEAPAK